MVGTMHIHSITMVELANQMGVSNKWLSSILNCKEKPADAEFRVWKALLELIELRQEKKEA